MNLVPDFVREYGRVASAILSDALLKVITDNFRCSKQCSENFVFTEKASSELMALGASLAESNPLKALAFREEDMRWA